MSFICPLCNEENADTAMHCVNCGVNIGSDNADICVNPVMRKTDCPQPVKMKVPYYDEFENLLKDLETCSFNKYKSKRFAEMMIKAFRDSPNNSIVRAVFSTVLASTNYNVDYNREVLRFIQREYWRGDASVFSVQFVFKIAFNNWYGEESFAFVAKVYNNEDSVDIKKEIVRKLIDYGHFGIHRPSLQRIYRKISREICTWDDEQLIGEWFAMCLRVHKETIFDDADELLDIVKTLDDDVFQVFVESLVSTFEDYSEVPVSPVWMYETLEKLVNERNHPRKRRLLNKAELLIKNYMSENDIRDMEENKG